MDFHYSTYRIHLRHPFTISRSSTDFYDIVFIFLTRNGITGVGEAVPSDRYHEPFERFMEVLKELTLGRVDEPDTLDGMLDLLLPKCRGVKALEAAFDVAAHDLWGKIEGIPLCSRFGGRPQNTPLTSFTIGIDRIDLIRQKVEEAAPFPILKVKLGSDRDEKIIETVRMSTDKLIRVDANEGWSLDEAQRMCDWLSTKNVEFVEQPLPAGKLDETSILKEGSPLKIIADENCLDSRDIPIIADAFHGVNIKLMKCGGLREASRMIEIAREMNLEVMLGCMVETSIATTAAAHLSPLVDYADLDGNLLIENDPYEGVNVEEGKLLLPSIPGLGVELRRTVT
ncbi:MAG: dipeptide epimerase [Candidatus Neomarinimicrobiota bacterium]